MHKVSILVPIYNVENYLKQCIDSVINQTLKDIEILLLDDGSTDCSPQICDEYATLDKRVKVIHKCNSGYGATINIGLEKATGEYIGIVEPDDYVDIDMYATLYNKARELNLDFIKADFYRFTGKDENLKLVYNKVAREDKNYNKVVNPSQSPEMLNYIMNTWSGIYKRKFLLENNIKHNETPGASFQDNGFWFKTFCLAKRAYFFDQPFYMNRRDNPNSSVKNPAKVYCMNEEYKFIKEWLNQHEEIKRKFIYMYNLKKYHNYMFTLKRIDSGFRKDYIKNISEEFAKDELNHEIDASLFGKQYKDLKLLIKNPIKFWKKNQNKSEEKIMRYYLFHCIPIIKIKQKDNKKKIYILGVPFFKIIKI